MYESDERALVLPLDAFQKECLVHPSEPSTRSHTHSFADEDEVRRLLEWTSRIGDKDVSLRRLVLNQQVVARQLDGRRLPIEEQARLQRPLLVRPLVRL